MYIHPLRSPSKTTRIGYENFKEVRVGHSFGLAVGMRCSCLGWHQGIKRGVWIPIEAECKGEMTKYNRNGQRTAA